MLFWLLIVVLIILAVATVPRWPYSREWGYVPMGGAILVLVILLLFLMLGWLPLFLYDPG